MVAAARLAGELVSAARSRWSPWALLLTTGTLYAGLLWALVTVVLTILLGPFFCGWVCPFGTLHQFCGFSGQTGETAYLAGAAISIGAARPSSITCWWSCCPQPPARFWLG